MDFSQAEGDLIDVSFIDTQPAVTGDQGFVFIDTAAFGGSGAAEARYQQLATSTLVELDQNGDGAADIAVVLTGLSALRHEDFLL